MWRSTRYYHAQEKSKIWHCYRSRPHLQMLSVEQPLTQIIQIISTHFTFAFFAAQFRLCNACVDLPALPVRWPAKSFDDIDDPSSDTFFPHCWLAFHFNFLHVFSMQKPFMRIPYTGPLPPPVIIPRNANTPTGAISALSKFLSAPPSKHLSQASRAHASQTVLLTGAGISVASGLADYRGTGGTYTLNKTYRPIYYNEFTSNHEARKRYWARSFLGWTNLHKARPNKGHQAVQELGNLGIVSSIITQSLSIP